MNFRLFRARYFKDICYFCYLYTSFLTCSIFFWFVSFMLFILGLVLVLLPKRCIHFSFRLLYPACLFIKSTELFVKTMKYTSIIFGHFYFLIQSGNFFFSTIFFLFSSVKWLDSTLTVFYFPSIDSISNFTWFEA